MNNFCSQIVSDAAVGWGLGIRARWVQEKIGESTMKSKKRHTCFLLKGMKRHATWFLLKGMARNTWFLLVWMKRHAWFLLKKG